MKARIQILVLMLAGVILTGCTSSSDQLNRLHIGMTVDEVTAILGKADSTSAQANVIYLTYYLDSPNNFYGREQPYMVRLVDGKVESFGRFRQLFDLYSRPITTAQPGDPNFPQAYGLGASTVIHNSSSMDLAGQIARLKALKDQGALTDEEFQKAKDKLLSNSK